MLNSLHSQAGLPTSIASTSTHPVAKTLCRGEMLPVVRQAQLESSQTCINAESESGTEHTTLLSACSSTDAKLPGILHYKKLAFNLNDSVVNCIALK